MTKRISLAALSAAILGAGLLPGGTSAQTPTCPPGTTQSPDGAYCQNAAGRILPSVTFKVRPGQDKTSPRRFTVRGKIGYPSFLSNSRACKGRVSVTYKAKRTTISTRRPYVKRLNGACRFTSSVKFSLPSRFLGARRLSVRVRFQGNQVLAPRSATRKYVVVR